MTVSVGGLIGVERIPGVIASLARLTQAALPAPLASAASWPGPYAAGIVTALVPFAGILAAALFYVTRPSWSVALLRNGAMSVLRAFWFSGWGFDWAYSVLFVNPFVRLTRLNRADAIDFFYRALGRAAEMGHRALVPTQSGLVRRYVMGIALGGAILIAVVLFL